MDGGELVHQLFSRLSWRDGPLALQPEQRRRRWLRRQHGQHFFVGTTDALDGGRGRLQDEDTWRGGYWWLLVVPTMMPMPTMPMGQRLVGGTARSRVFTVDEGYYVDGRPSTMEFRPWCTLDRYRAFGVTPEDYSLWRGLLH